MKSEQTTQIPEFAAPSIFMGDIPVSNIFTGTARRRLAPKWIVALAESIAEIGLMQPIEVVAEGGGYLLISGAHRLAAYKQLGLDSIPCIVKAAADIKRDGEIKIREITENLVRNNLTMLDRSFDVAVWRDFYVATHNLNKGGRPKTVNVNEWEEKLTEGFAVSFSEAARDALNISERTVFNYLKVASMGETIRQRVALHPMADNQSELLALAAETPSRQSAIVDLLLAEAEGVRTVAEAIARIDAVAAPAKPERWAAFSSKFAKMREADQFRFFDANSAAIELWLKAR